MASGEINLSESSLDSHSAIYLSVGPNEDSDYFTVTPGPDVKITRMGIFAGSYEAVEVETIDPKSKQSACRIFFRPCFQSEIPQGELPN
jgi:hypothetical protein